MVYCLVWYNPDILAYICFRQKSKMTTMTKFWCTWSIYTCFKVCLTCFNLSFLWLSISLYTFNYLLETLKGLFTNAWRTFKEPLLSREPGIFWILIIYGILFLKIIVVLCIQVIDSYVKNETCWRFNSALNFSANVFFNPLTISFDPYHTSI